MPATASKLEDPPAPVAAVGISLRASFQWAIAGNAVYAACQWAILIVMTKFQTAEAVGQFALGLAITAPIMLFANLQLGAVQATDARHEYRFGHYLALRLIVTSIALAVIAALAIGVGYRPLTAAVVVVVGVAKAFEMISGAYHGLMQQHRRFERVAWSMMLKGVLSVVAVAVWLGLGGDILGAAGALALTWALLFFLYDLGSPAWLCAVEPSCQENKFLPVWEWRRLGKLAWQAFPLGVWVALFTLSLYIPRYFVEQYLGEKQLGFFAALAYVTLVSQVLSNALAQAAAPRLAAHYALREMRAFRILVLTLVGTGVLLGGAGVVLAMVAGRPLLTLLYRPEYAEHAEVFTWIMAGASLWCVTTMLVAAANAARRQTSQAAAGIAVVVATLGASVMLIPTHGLTGAAIASVIGGMVGVLAFGAIFLSIGMAPRGAAAGTQ